MIFFYFFGIGTIWDSKNPDGTEPCFIIQLNNNDKHTTGFPEPFIKWSVVILQVPSLFPFFNNLIDVLTQLTSTLWLW